MGQNYAAISIEGHLNNKIGLANNFILNKNNDEAFFILAEGYVYEINYIFSISKSTNDSKSDTELTILFKEKMPNLTFLSPGHKNPEIVPFLKLARHLHT